MKKQLFMISLAVGLTGFYSCDSKTENSMEMQAKEVKESAEMAGDTALERQAKKVKDSIDAVDPK